MQKQSNQQTEKNLKIRTALRAGVPCTGWEADKCANEYWARNPGDRGWSINPQEGEYRACMNSCHA